MSNTIDIIVIFVVMVLLALARVDNEKLSKEVTNLKSQVELCKKEQAK